MKCIILCAGYATGLYPLTEKIPKALLEIEKGKPLLNYTIEKVDMLTPVDEIFLVTNDLFYGSFQSWLKTINSLKPITIISDHTMSNQDRLGEIVDFQYTLNLKNIADDVLVLLGDNLFDFDLKEFLEYYKLKKMPVIGGQYEESAEILSQFNVMEVDSDQKLIGFEETPSKVKGNLKSLGIYLYPKYISSVLKQYLEAGNKSDSFGQFIQYLYQKEPVYVFKFEGNWFDVGTKEELLQVRDLYNHN